MNETKIFECAKLLEVEESQPAAGGEVPTHGIGKVTDWVELELHVTLYALDSRPASSTIAIDLCSWRECVDHSMLILFCNNGQFSQSRKFLWASQLRGYSTVLYPPGYLMIRMTPAFGTPVIKQLKWFESSMQHVLDMTLDPLGEWLACACLDGCLCLLPVLHFTKKVGRQRVGRWIEQD